MFGWIMRILWRNNPPKEEQTTEPPLLDEPWRELRWGDRQRDLQYVQEYKPARENIRYLRVLLYGPVGAGKSSFINSVSNVLRERITIPALASATTSDKSFTKQYDTHKFAKGRGSSKTFYSVVFNDIMGLEDGSNNGVHANDIKLALEGHIKEGHKSICPPCTHWPLKVDTRPLQHCKYYGYGKGWIAGTNKFKLDTKDRNQKWP
ncbi:hypothetical protein CHARACLAT_026630 [Characodon lateralis]|uniref:Interferon-induced protein 44-like n=1 Tax=Characodon lateralis TaxID=208331 RepID=A0ABU7ED31_9TELE|nr:hypothetical protein [Characodon lateralis]